MGYVTSNLLIRWRVFQCFSIRELLVLLIGKVFSQLRTNQYEKLQHLESNLRWVLKYNEFAHIDGEEANLVFPLFEQRYHFYLRTLGSDVMVFNQVIGAREYDFVFDCYEQYFRRPPQTLIDAGSNIGLVSVYFTASYPDIRIVAVEPDAENCKVARKHIAANNLANVELLESALWPIHTRLSIVRDFRDQLNWSIRVEEDQSGSLLGITPAELIGHFHPAVDIMKIDIEGGEAKLFADNADICWLDQIKLLALEIHDECVNRDNLIAKLQAKGFIIQTQGELTVGVNGNRIEN